MSTDDIVVAELEGVERAIGNVFYHVSHSLDTEAHNLRVRFIDTLGLWPEKDDLVRRIAAGLSQAFQAVAEGRDPMARAPRLVPVSPNRALRKALWAALECGEAVISD
jgi:hypothetical protein